MTAGQFFYTSDAVQTTTAASLTSGATSVQLTAITGWPTQFPCTLLLEWGTANQEVVTLTQAATGGGPYTFANCLRGQDGTTGVSHSSGAQANHGVSARDFFQAAPVVNVCAYGADPTGTNDSTTAINNAIAAIPSGGGSIYLPEGSYKHSGTLSFDKDQGMTGAGSTATFLNYTGSGTAVKVLLSTSFTGGDYGGRFSGFFLSGYGAGGSAIGLRHGDLQGTVISDVAIYGFGGIGLNCQNSAGWSEQLNFQVRIVQCGTAGSNTSCAVIHDTSSHDYSNLDYTIVTGNGTGGLYIQNNAQLQGCYLRMRGNFYGSAGNTAAVIALDKAGGSHTSYVTNTFCDVAVESAGSNTGHYTVYLGSTNSGSQFLATGVLDFNNVAISFQGYSNANFVPFSFSGIVNDQVLGIMQDGDSIALCGAIDFRPNGALNSHSGGTGVDIYFQFGDVIENLLNNGTNTFAFHGVASAYARRVDLWLSQPGSGAAGTVVWPSGAGGVKWATGSAPTLSSTNGYVDHIRLTFLPDTGFWYGELAGTHYA